MRFSFLRIGGANFGLAPGKPRELLLHDAGERRRAKRQDRVIEVVARIVHRHASDRIAITDVDVGAGARFEHEGEILRRHDQVAFALDILLARLHAGLALDSRYLASLGHGGLLGREAAWRIPPYEAALEADDDDP